MNPEISIEELKLKANTIREDIIKMVQEAGSGHIAGPLGLADIFTALYFKVMKNSPSNPDWDQRDILILSNGHCVPVRYATMAEAGYFKKEELMTLRKYGSRLQGHPERTRMPGMETTSGPLGSGLSQACGIALALRMDKVKDRFVYVVMGDGEQNEGNVWEAAMLAAKYKLSNIIAITDRNNIQIDGPTESVMPMEDLHAKWKSFGWFVIEVNGNNIEEFINATGLAKAIEDKLQILSKLNLP
jgi:transketolase